MGAVLEIEGLCVSVEGKPILKGVDLALEPGKIHALMGPNGSGKSTLSSTLLGHPKYEVTGGRVRWKGEDILELTPDERARRGMFLAFQYPQEIAGVSLAGFLRSAVNAVRSARGDKEFSVIEFRRVMAEKMQTVKMPPKLSERYLNQGFSGGEKKRTEVLQMALLSPELAVMDETDSGLDIDALKAVSEGVRAIRADQPEMSVLLITHYQRILKYLQPDHVHVMVNGKIAHSGGPELADRLEQDGYDWVTKEAR